MKQLLCGLLLLVFPGASAAKPTPPIHDPKAFVASVYHRLATDHNYSPPTDIYTKRLNALWAGMDRDANGEVGRVDFEFWANGQDWEITNTVITADSVFGRPDRQIIRTRFQNFAHPEDIQFYFEKVGSRWLLDDACSVGKNSWTLSLLLKYGY